MIRDDDYTPSYIHVYNALKAELIQYPVGANIPPERTLCTQYGLDRGTIRKALAMLAEEGYIERKQGRGTRVLRHDREPGGIVLFVLCQGARMVDRSGEPFYAQSLDALETNLHALDRQLLYSKVLCGDDLGKLCHGLNAQAVILAGTPDASILEQSRALSLPVIGYNTYISDLPSVVVDNDGAAAVSAQHLLALGHRRIGFIHVPGFINSEKRLSRFRIEQRNAGLADDALCIAEGDWSEQSGYLAARDLLTRPGERITALFGGNDSMSIGAMRAAQELGLSLPDDLSLIGFDGISQSAFTVPPLTTSQVDVKAMAEATCMLLGHVLGGCSARGIRAMVSTRFIVRSSTAAPRR